MQKDDQTGSPEAQGTESAKAEGRVVSPEEARRAGAAATRRAGTDPAPESAGAAELDQPAEPTHPPRRTDFAPSPYPRKPPGF